MIATLKLRRADAGHGRKAANLADEFRRLKALREGVTALADGAEDIYRSGVEECALTVYDECGRQMLDIAERYFALTDMKAS